MIDFETLEVTHSYKIKQLEEAFNRYKAEAEARAATPVEAGPPVMRPTVATDAPAPKPAAAKPTTPPAKSAAAPVASDARKTAVAAIEIAKEIDTAEVDCALDVGGANGEVIRAMMRANPVLHGGVFDLPHVVPDAAEAARSDGLLDRFTAFGGDFFEFVPSADLYVLKYILHDWDDESCIRILKNCRASLEEGGRIVVIDYLVGELGAPGPAPLMDLNMLVMTGGRERDIVEFDALFESAGLRRTTVGHGGPFAIIETVPI